MTKYLVANNTLPNGFQFDTPYKCHKVRKSLGKLSYKITKEANGLILYIENINATKRQKSSQNVAGTVAKKIDLTNILNNLPLNFQAGSVAKLLPFIGDNNNAGFVAAVLIDQKIVKII